MWISSLAASAQSSVNDSRSRLLPLAIDILPILFSGDLLPEMLYYSTQEHKIQPQTVF